MKTNKNVLGKLYFSLVYTNDILLSFLSSNKKVIKKFKFLKQDENVNFLLEKKNWYLAIITDFPLEICDTEFGE